MGPSKLSGLFAFGVGAGFLNENGLGQNPFLFSSPSILEASPKTTEKEMQVSSLRSSRNGGNKQVGDLLQGKSHSNQRRDNPVDKAGSNQNLGVV